MGRFTAWMGNRRNTQRPAKGACGGRAARSLGFEQCEQRIALSTNAPYEPAHFALAGYGESEGGFIVLTNGAGVTISTWQADIVRTFSSGTSAADQWSWTNAYDSDYAFKADSTGGEFARNQGFNLSPSLLGNGSYVSGVVPGMTWNGEAFANLDFSGFDGVDILITESNVVPIPPPSAGPHGNEGGQISMIPFIGPSMFGLPGANESQLAVRTRQALGAEPLESTPAADSSPADSLRARAVVYEVAQTRPLMTSAEEVALKRTDSENAVDDAGSVAGFETASHRDGASQHGAVRLASFSFEATSEAEYARKAAVAADRAAVDALFVRESREDQRQAADEEAVDEQARSRVARAHDDAFDELEQAIAPLEEQREAAAATADANQRRLIGGTLIAVAAVPVLKTIRRKGQRQAVEVRPRRSFHAE
jgi:hypothetical protein